MIDAKTLQRAVGSNPDGILGPATFAALFRKGGANVDRAEELGLAANVRLKEYGVLDNPLRLAHFMAQLMHESGNFRYMEEIANGQAYEGRKDLGNTIAGDGKRFKGRGPIQLTGRANYRKYGRIIGIDIERHPEIAAIPSIGLWTALEYWRQNGINAIADKDDILSITKRINGGTNGIADRKAKLAQTKQWLGI